MRNPIKSSPGFKLYPSFDKIASELQKKWPEVFEDNGIKRRSLGRKIGELNSGNPTWWLTRKDETNCLIELLDIDRDELGLHQKTGRHIFALSAFPDFPPLDLMREDCWSIATPELLSEDRLQENDRYASKPTLDAWLSPQGSPYPRKKVEWLYVPDETEYQLLTRKLDAIGRHRFASHNSLREAIEKDIDLVRNQKPLILAIHEKSKAGDLEALISYRQGAPLLVISPSPLPDLPPEKENETAEQSDADKTKIKRSDVNCWIWTLLPNWRAKLPQWLEEHWPKEPMAGLKIDETYFCSEGTQVLLDKLDPSGKWFAGVEDVLTLCQAVSEKKRGELNALADSEELLLQLFNLDKSGLGSTILRQLIERRWKRSDQAWEGELDEKIWMEMTSDLCNFETLLTQQLIVRGIGRRYDFKRPILIRLLLRSQLMAALMNGVIDAWAPACFDNQRRPLVDAALDAMNIEQLKQIAAQLIEAPTSAATIGAGEALFAAIGRRIINKEDIDGRIIREEEDISRELLMLADRVLKQLTWDNGMLWPYSRPLENMAQVLEWICVCWAWSLTPSPGTNLPPNWLFPGWYPELPQTMPEWLNSIDRNFFNQDMTIPMRDFLSVVRRWLADHETPPTFEKMPSLFNAGLLALAAADQWPASPDWWWGLLGNRNAEQTLLHQVEVVLKLVSTRTALAWWPSLVKHQREKFSNQFKGSMYYTCNWNELGYSVLLNWVMEQMDKPSVQVLNGLDDEDRKFLMLYPAALPTSVKCQLLKSLAKDFPKNWQAFSFINFFQHYGRDTADELAGFLDNDELGDQAARCLWEWAPRKAEILLKKRDYNRKALRRLILAIPSSSAIGDAVALLRDDPALLSDKERRDWARRFLPDARQYAQDLLQLLNTKTEE